MWGAAEKANKNRAARARRKEAGFQKPSQADESAARDIRHLAVFAVSANRQKMEVSQ